MAYEVYSAEKIAAIEDRLQTILTNLRQIRQHANAAPSGTVSVQLGSCDVLLDRLERLAFNAVAQANHSAYQETRGKYAEEAASEIQLRVAESRKEFGGPKP